MSEQQHILDFCANCGFLLEEGMGLYPITEQDCPNCGVSVYERSKRIQGYFEPDEAERLKRVYWPTEEGR